MVTTVRPFRDIVVAVVIATALPPVPAEALAPGGTFLDDDRSVHEGAIEALAAEGIVRGCGGERFCPEAPVTRGQMAALLVRAVPDLPTSPTDTFEDDHGVFEADIERLVAAGVTNGCNPPENDRFCPDDPVTREQMAAFLVRVLELGAAPGTIEFSDDDDSPFESEIERLAANGIVVGCNPPDNDHYCPRRDVTRAEMASLLARGLGLEPRPPPLRLALEVIRRRDWGAAPAAGPFREHVIEQITIHHAASSLSSTGPPQFRNWQAYHQSLGWPDIAYHHIVGRDGRLYEGRPLDAAGDTATSYDPTGHYLIVMEGDFDHDEPTPAQVETLARALAWASAMFDVSPTELTGHRDHAATTCPGDNLYALIDDGTLAARVEELLAAGGVTLVEA
jgi:hypothetical protein